METKKYIIEVSASHADMFLAYIKGYAKSVKELSDSKDKEISITKEEKRIKRGRPKKNI